MFHDIDTVRNSASVFLGRYGAIKIVLLLLLILLLLILLLFFFFNFKPSVLNSRG